MSTQRDYSAVEWPWDGDPCWDAPREGATSDPGDDGNWQLQCGECALQFPMDYTVENIGSHWKGHFPEWTEDVQEPGIRLNLVWRGLGPPPAGGRPNG